MQKNIMLLSILFITSFAACSLITQEGIQPYDKVRDNTFVTQLAARFPVEIPDTPLYPDVDVEKIEVDIPTGDGTTSVHASYTQKLFVYLIKDKPVGYVRIFDNRVPILGFDTTTSWLAAIAVDPAHQGRGIATKLAQHAFADAKKRGRTKMIFDVVAGNEKSELLWKKLGFSEDSSTRKIEQHFEECWGAYKRYILDLTTNNI